MEPINTDKRDDAAERFALDQMEGQELDDYLAQLLLDPALRADVASVRERIKSVRGMAQPSPAPTLYGALAAYWLVLAMLLGGLLFWWLRPVVPVPAPPPTHLPAKQPSSPSSPPVADTPPSAVRRPPSTRPIAANLRPNPALEYQLGAGQYRTDNAQGFRWTRSPETQPVFAQQGGKTRFAFDAAAIASAEVAAQLRWQIFSNRKSDYEAGRAQHTGQLAARLTSNDAYSLSAQADVTLPPGLYYYLVEDAESGAVYFIGKFVVE